MTQEEALNLFDYKDGILYWKNRPKTSRKTKDDNEAGTKTGHGYKKITVNQKKYHVHQLVYLMKHGFIPKLIDHIDNNPSNNKIENLREASKSQNAFNSKIRKDNTTGVKGVSWHKKAKKWMIQITINNKSKYLGCYEDLELAELVAVEARNKYYGEYARHF